MLLLEKALNLRILEIYNGNFSSINQATHLMSKIEILKLGKMTASCQSLINLINSLPQLRILEFENCQITGQLAKHGLLRTTKIRQLTFDDSIIQDVHFSITY
ncbi:MAG: hypothetical protein HWD59_01590 [Coxiellaceae bacterium]|nr:MAG: hypothetical protein HWD59_01590 [Coxiellaceae bacterium]